MNINLPYRMVLSSTFMLLKSIATTVDISISSLTTLSNLKIKYWSQFHYTQREVRAGKSITNIVLRRIKIEMCRFISMLHLQIQFSSCKLGFSRQLYRCSYLLPFATKQAGGSLLHKEHNLYK